MSDLPIEASIERPIPKSEKLQPKFAKIFQQELGRFDPALVLLKLVLKLLPHGKFGRLRTALLRLGGFKIGSGTVILGSPVFAGNNDPRVQLRIGSRCVINWPLHLDLNGTIEIGDCVSIGHHVVIVTTDHQPGTPIFRAGSPFERSVSIGNGAWVGACATILPGVKIGAGSVVASGAVLGAEVPSNTLYGGNPARMIRQLSTDDSN